MSSVDPFWEKPIIFSLSCQGTKSSRKEIHSMTQRKTSVRAGRAASKVLRDLRTSRPAKIAAGSALSQRAPVKKRPKK